MSYSIRSTTQKDVSVIFDFIKDLARYEKMEDQVVGTEQELCETLFGESPKAEVIFLEEEGKPVGFALFFHNYSTFLCRPGIYIEDVYVKEAYRGKGYGKALFKHICALAKERQCGRVEWWCLNWNTPSIEFYKRLGAKAMDEWTVFRLTEKEIHQLAE